MLSQNIQQKSLNLPDLAQDRDVILLILDQFLCKCGHRGVIYSKCPVCGSDDILRMRRITGYLTGSLESWNSAKQAEERDRVKHR